MARPSLAKFAVVFPRILIVEDDLPLRKLIELALARKGIRADTAADGLAALERLAERRYSVILLDLMMPRLSGYDLIGELRGLRPKPTTLVMTAMPDNASLVLDPDVVTAIVRKPFDIDVLVSIVVEIAGAMSGEQRPNHHDEDRRGTHC